MENTENATTETPAPAPTAKGPQPCGSLPYKELIAIAQELKLFVDDSLKSWVRIGGGPQAPKKVYVPQPSKSGTVTRVDLSGFTLEGVPGVKAVARPFCRVSQQLDFMQPKEVVIEAFRTACMATRDDSVTAAPRLPRRQPGAVKATPAPAATTAHLKPVELSDEELRTTEDAAVIARFSPEQHARRKQLRKEWREARLREREAARQAEQQQVAAAADSAE